MIVFLNVEQQLIEVYSAEGKEVFFFDETEDFEKYVKNKKCLYITEAHEVEAKDISHLVSNSIVDSDELNDGSMYLQSCASGYVVLDELGISFDGKGDCKLIDEELQELMDQSRSVKVLLKNGKLKIIDYKEMVKASRKQARNRQKESKKTQALRDEQLDSILADPSVSASDLALKGLGESEEINLDGISGDDGEVDMEDMMEVTPEQLKELL